MRVSASFQLRLVVLALKNHADGDFIARGALYKLVHGGGDMGEMSYTM